MVKSWECHRMNQQYLKLGYTPKLPHFSSGSMLPPAIYIHLPSRKAMNAMSSGSPVPSRNLAESAERGGRFAPIVYADSTL